MPAADSLSDLCTICYTNKPKYRCPRCRTQTCSLACYRRHQQRASCNGRRDPTVYRKKNQLATPAGIDHDYNYLRSVERRIEDADHRTANEPGNEDGPQAAAARTTSRARHPQGALQRYLHENRITIEYAPKGMSRQRSNQTRSSNRGKILWTVEWVDDGQSSTSSSAGRHLQHDCLASKSVAATYEHLLAERRNAAKRQFESTPQQDKPLEPRGSKRKRGSDIDKTNNKLGEDITSTSTTTEPSIPPEQLITQTEQSEIPTAKATNLPPENSEAISSSTGDHLPQPADDTKDPSEHKALRLTTERRFFLLHPDNRTLIPLGAGTASLTEALKGQRVKEFPTIHILYAGRGEFPPTVDAAAAENVRIPIGFRIQGKDGGASATRSPGSSKVLSVNEDNHNVRNSKQPAIAERGIIAGLDGQVEGGGEVNRVLDAQSILDMLKRDLRA